MASPYIQTKNLEIYLANVASTPSYPIVRARVQVKQFKQYLTTQVSTTPEELEAKHPFVDSMSSFEPTLEDLHAIIQSIARCETEKYRQYVDDPRKLFSEFLAASAYEPDFEKLKQKYAISHEKGVNNLNTG